MARQAHPAPRAHLVPPAPRAHLGPPARPVHLVPPARQDRPEGEHVAASGRPDHRWVLRACPAPVADRRDAVAVASRAAREDVEAW